MNDKQNEHPWVKSARQAKENANQEPEPIDEDSSTAPSGLFFFSVVFLLLLITSVSVSMYLIKKQAALVAHSDTEQVLVWHSGRAEEAAQLQMWAHDFSVESGVQVKVAAQPDLQTSLIRTMMSVKAPALAIVDASLAGQLAASGVLLPLSSSSGQTLLPLAAESTFTRAQVLIAPRGRKVSTSTQRFIDYIEARTAVVRTDVPTKPPDGSILPETSTLR